MCFFQSIRQHKHKAGSILLILSGLLAFSLPALAKGAAGPPPVSSMENPLAVTLLVIIAVLALIIILLAWVVNGAADVFISRYRKAKSGIVSAMILGFLLGSNSAGAQDAAAAGSGQIGGMDSLAFYFLTGVIAVELIAILYLLYNLRLLIRAELANSGITKVAVAPTKPKESWWSKFNKFKPVEQEADIDLGHDYDGIRELDNRLPPWWLYGFYLCILFAAIYLWRFHVTHTGPSSVEEFNRAMAIADKQKEEYLKKAANNIDENSVVMMDAAGIAAGQALYITNCAACHGKQGEGTVGPNLTDDYWLHGGSINDIFKTIKYGVPEKGMRSWQEDLSPVKMAQISSFIKSIHGSNPPNPKEKQGELYKEATPAAGDSVKPATLVDSTSVSSVTN
ncbi:c-type cytochrome [Flavihumibacter sp. RY-1]|uniref:C-type cytochrome n=1 Tax=Flavihumibacter fluminis TaxID=2909236 RepID=A0ABS9BHT8_9BACT|nr:cbb3-type cytochrome c oxidase N-terminal domain-containing protein [Flavihumibacter fluminis]MCF1714221.1 c-type cytochrome [Flavihumibacter fluminis]